MTDNKMYNRLNDLINNNKEKPNLPQNQYKNMAIDLYKQTPLPAKVIGAAIIGGWILPGFWIAAGLSAAAMYVVDKATSKKD